MTWNNRPAPQANLAAARQATCLVLCVGGQLLLSLLLSPVYKDYFFIYVVFFMLYPATQSTEGPGALCLAFVMGLLLDALGNSWGVHACAAVSMVYGRAWLAPLFFGGGPTERVHGHYGGWRWPQFALWALLLTLSYHGVAALLMSWGSLAWPIVPLTLWRVGITWGSALILRFFLR